MLHYNTRMSLHEKRQIICNAVIEHVGVANMYFVENMLRRLLSTTEKDPREIFTFVASSTIKCQNKSLLCKYMLQVFCESYFSSEELEPFSHKHQLISLMSGPISETMHIMGMMYFKGMDMQFWAIIKANADRAVTDLFNMLEQVAEPSAWIFAYLLKYGIYVLKIEDISIDPENWVPTPHAVQAWSDYALCRHPFPHGVGPRMSSSDYFVIKSDLVSNPDIVSSLPQGACTSWIEFVDQFDPIPPTSMFETPIQLAEAPKVRLSNLGILQCCGVYIYCWLGGRRYVMQKWPTRSAAVMARDAISTLRGLLSDTTLGIDVICHEAFVVVTDEDFTPPARVMQNRAYYTIQRAPPYGLTLTEATLASMAVRLLQYLLGWGSSITSKYAESPQISLHTFYLSSDFHLDDSIKSQLPKFSNQLKEWFLGLSIPAKMPPGGSWQARHAIVSTLLI